MSRACFEPAFNEIQKHEVGIEGRRFGVSRELYAENFGLFPDEVSLDGLTPNIAQAVLRRMVWDRMKADHLPAGLDVVLFDAAVCHGVLKPVIWLQMILRDRQDGEVTQRTLMGVNNFVARYRLDGLINTFRKQRDFQNERSPEFKKLGAAEKARNQAVTDAALKLLFQ